MPHQIAARRSYELVARSGDAFGFPAKPETPRGRAPRWAVGQRTCLPAGRRQGVPAYACVAPLAPGGVGALGANPKAEDGPVHDDKEVCAMKIELRPLAEIKPYEKNPRLNDGAVDAVAESIRRFGFRQPIVVDGEGVIVCGHTRWKAAHKLRLEKVPVHVARDLTPEQIKAYRIADNKTAELAEWNLDLLPIELAELNGVGLDWSLLGFDADELAMLLDPGVKHGLTDPDDIPEPPDEATTQPGDLWVLGDHRLLCGDSRLAAADVDRLLDGQPIHLVNTDPPYNVKVEPRSNNAIAAGLSSFQATGASAAGS